MATETDRLEYIISAVNRTQGAVNSAAGNMKQLKDAAVAANHAMKAAAGGVGGAFRSLAGSVTWLLGIFRSVFGIISGILRTVVSAIGSVIGAVFSLARAIGGVLFNAASRVFGYMASAAKVAVLSLAGAFAYLGKRGIDVNIQMEQVERTLTTILKSKSAAQALMGDIVKEAATSAFSVRELSQFTVKLIAYGFAVKSIVPTMRVLRDTAAGLGGGAETMDRLVRSLGQIKAKGIMSGEEAMQLTELGIPVRQFLGIPTGKDIADAKIPAEKAIADILKGLSGSFGGLEEKASKSLVTVLSNIGDALDKFAGKVTSGLFAKLTEASTKLLEFVDSLNKTEQGQVLLQEISKAFDRVGDAAINLVKRLPEGLKWLADFISSEKWEKFKAAAIKAWENFKATATVVVEEVWKKLKEWAAWLESKWPAIWNTFVSVTFNMARSVGGVLIGLGAVIVGFFEDIANGQSTMTGGLGGLKIWAADLIRIMTLTADSLANYALAASAAVAAGFALSGNLGGAATWTGIAAGLKYMTGKGESGKSRIKEAGFEAAAAVQGFELTDIPKAIGAIAGPKATARFEEAQKGWKGFLDDAYLKAQAAGSKTGGPPSFADMEAAWMRNEFNILPELDRTPANAAGATAAAAPGLAPGEMPPTMVVPSKGEGPYEPLRSHYVRRTGDLSEINMPPTVRVDVNVNGPMDMPKQVGDAVRTQMEAWVRQTYGTATA